VFDNKIREFLKKRLIINPVLSCHDNNAPIAEITCDKAKESSLSSLENSSNSKKVR